MAFFEGFSLAYLPNIDLANLSGDNDFIFECSAGDQCGYSVTNNYPAAPGNQMYIGAPGAADTGEVYLLNWNETWPDVITKNFLDGKTGTIISGESSGDALGSFIYPFFYGAFLTAPKANSEAGVVYYIPNLIQCSTEFPINLLNLNTPGYCITGTKFEGDISNGLFGSSMTIIPDVNGGRSQDFLIAAPGANVAYILFSEYNFGEVFNIKDLTLESGLKLTGAPEGSNIQAISNILFFSNNYALGASGSSRMYIINTNGKEPSDFILDLEALDGNNGTVILGNSNSNFGNSVAGEDSNRLFVGAPNEDNNGEVYLIATKSFQGNARVSVSSASSYKISGENKNDHFGLNGGIYYSGTSVNDYLYAFSSPAEKTIYLIKNDNIHQFDDDSPPSITNLDQLDGENGFVVLVEKSSGANNLQVATGFLVQYGSKGLNYLVIGDPEIDNNAGKVYFVNPYKPDPSTSPSPSPTSSSQPSVYTPDNTIEIVFGVIGGIVGLSLLCYCLTRLGSSNSPASSSYADLPDQQPSTREWLASRGYTPDDFTNHGFN